MDVSDDELTQIYLWVDGIPLSRPKKNISRDFSDGGARPCCVGTLRAAPQHGLPGPSRAARRRRRGGAPARRVGARGSRARGDEACGHRAARHAVLAAEIVSHFFPRLVELHNYRCAGPGSRARQSVFERPHALERPLRDTRCWRRRRPAVRARARALTAG